MDFSFLAKAMMEHVAEKRILEEGGEGVSVTRLIRCGKKARLAETYPLEEEFSADVFTGYAIELFVKEALQKAYGDKVTLEKAYSENFEGLNLIGHVDAVVEFENKVVGIDIKAPKKVFAVKEVSDQDKKIHVDYEGLILHNPTYLLQASIYKRMMEKEHAGKKVEFYLLYHSLVNGNKRTFTAVPVEVSIGDEALRRVINRYRAELPAYRSECESYCQYKRKNLCEGVELTDEEPYEKESVEGVLQAYVRALREYETAKENLDHVAKLLRQLIPDGTINWKGQEVGWKTTVGYSFDPDAFINFVRSANPEELKEVVAMLTHKPAFGKKLNEMGLTEERQKVDFVYPKLGNRR